MFLKGHLVYLHNLPARNFISLTAYDNFPLFFCVTRWMENQKILDCLIDVWNNVKKIMFWEKLSKSKQPTCKTFSDVLLAVIDPLTVVKFQFLITFCCQSFLTIPD